MTIATQAAVKVPWTEEQEQHLKELRDYTENEQWDIGDTALKAVPMGKVPGQRNQAKAYLELLAHRTGLEPGTLRKCRDVVRAWPAPLRSGAASFAAHAAYVTGGPKKASERAELFERIANDPNTPFGRVTVKLVKENKPVKIKAQSSTKTERRRSFANRGSKLLAEIDMDHMGPEDRERLQHAIGLFGRLERDDV